MQYSMITEYGLNQINAAHPLGQYIEIAYYVPVYDYRIDNNILPTDTNISATEISTCTSSSDRHPQGEILWNTSGAYSLSTQQKYLVRTGNEIISTSGSYQMINNFAHREVFTINEFNLSAIGNYYTADEVNSPGNNGVSWFLSNAGYQLLSPPTSSDGYGPVNIDEPESQFLYKGVSYQQVISSEDNSRANFKVTLRAERGQIKFNKIGLYGVKRTADGILATNPFLFGQVIIPEPQILYSNDVGSTGKVTEITLDFQIESKTLSAGTFESVFYSTSGDYWVRTTNEKNGNYGLLYDGSVYITNTLAVDETGGLLDGDNDRSIAKLLVGTFEYVNKPITSAEKEMPQLCLQYVSSQGIESKRIRSTFKTNKHGDLELDMYGACLNSHSDTNSVIPNIDRGYGLGLSDNKWSHLYLSNKLQIFNNSWENVLSGTDFLDSYIHIDSDNSFAHFGNSNVFVGPYNNQANASVKMHNLNYVYGNISSYKSSAIDENGVMHQHGYDLLIRSLNDIVMVTLSAGNENTFTAEEIISKIWNISKSNDNIIQYLGRDKDILLVAGRNIHTWGNIIPLSNKANTLGDNEHLFSGIYTRSIIGDDGSVRINANIIPGANRGLKIKESTFGGQTYYWDEITALQFGRENRFIERAYLHTIYSRQLEFGDASSINFKDGILMSNHAIENIDRIGTNDSPVDVIYVNDLIIKNQYKSYYAGNNTLLLDFVTYNTDFFNKVQSQGFTFSDVTLRYDTITKKGKLYVSINTNNTNFATSKRSYGNINLNIVNIPYNYFKSKYGIDTITLSSFSDPQLEQNMIIDPPGLGNQSNKLTKFSATLISNSDGFWINGLYTTVNDLNVVKQNSGIVLLNSFSVNFDVTLESINSNIWVSSN